MPGRNRLFLLVAALMALGVASCGGDEDSSPTAVGRETPAQERNVDPSPRAPGGSGGKGSSEDRKERADAEDGASSSFAPEAHDDSGGGSEQFRVKGGDNSVQEFGAEAEGSEFEEAAAALHNFFDARAEQEWAAACEYLASGLAESMEEAASATTEKEGTSCAVGLENSTNLDAKRALRKEAAQVDVGSVRLEGESGFVLYRVGETVYAISIAIEDGAFKVAGLSGLPLT